MPTSVQNDSITFSSMEQFSYNRVESELSEIPRLIRGNNTYITIGGKLIKRMGTIEVANTILTNRIDRLWVYETLETPPKVYLLASAFDDSISRWKMWYNRLSGPSPGWVNMGTLRDLDKSTAPHEAAISRGLVYIKGLPAAGGDKLGSVVFDGSGSGTPVTKFWGLVPPQQAARIKGAVTRLNGAINNITTAITVVSNTGFPAPNFIVIVDFEQMLVTSVGGGTNWTVTRGYNGTFATNHPDLTSVIYRNFSASTHRVHISYGWQYVYCWKTSTGQYSSRSPLETNPDKMPSITGAFDDLIPKVTVRGHPDTTNVPTIVLFRSTDGGGTFFHLRDIANTGDVDIDVLDNQLGSGPTGAVFNDPIPDNALDTANVAPSLTSNDPPPTVLAPKVVGTDTPDQYTPLATFAGRIWFAIGNVVFYSAQEELSNGVPEESFPSGLRGNFFRFAQPVMNLVASTDSLYVMTLQSTFQITGTNRETFSARLVMDAIGAPYGHPRAVSRFGPTVCYLTQDFRVVTVENDEHRIISDPLFTDLTDAVNATVGAELDLEYWADAEKELLFITGHRKLDPTLSQQWGYDLKLSDKRPFETSIFSSTPAGSPESRRRDFWHTPWTIQSTAMVSGRLFENQAQRRMTFFVWDPTIKKGRLVRLDPTMRTATDIAPGDATKIGADFSYDTHLITVPPGNHINALRKPDLAAVVTKIVLERSLFQGDTDPKVYYYLDDFWTDANPTPPAEDPPRRELSKAYKTQQHFIWTACQRIAVGVRKLASKELYEQQNLTVTWTPDSGA